MANVRTNVTDAVIRQIMEGKDPRAAIDAALDEGTSVTEKAGYHKEKRIRGGNAEVVNVKNKKRKVHHALTAGQKKAIKKAHSAAANRKRAKSIKKGAKMGLYKESIDLMAEGDEEEVKGLGIACPSCGEGQLEIFTDPEVEETDGVLLVCPDCGETFVICSTSEIEDDDDKDDDDKDDDDKKEDAGEAPAEEAPAEETPQDESVEVSEKCEGDECTEECGDEKEENCGDGEPQEESGLFFAAE